MGYLAKDIVFRIKVLLVVQEIFIWPLFLAHSS